jgi:hypothetical protein
MDTGGGSFCSSPISLHWTWRRGRSSHYALMPLRFSNAWTPSGDRIILEEPNCLQGRTVACSPFDDPLTSSWLAWLTSTWVLLSLTLSPSMGLDSLSVAARRMISMRPSAPTFPVRRASLIEPTSWSWLIWSKWPRKHYMVPFLLFKGPCPYPLKRLRWNKHIRLPPFIFSRPALLGGPGLCRSLDIT